MGRPRATSPQHIVRAAETLFAAQGYRNTSLDDIATAVGVSRTTVLTYFPSKSAILWDHWHRGVVRIAEELNQAALDEPPHGLIRRAFRVGVSESGVDREVARAMLRIVDQENLYVDQSRFTQAGVEAIRTALVRRPPLRGDDLLAGAAATAIAAASAFAANSWALSDQDDSLTDAVDRAIVPILNGYVGPASRPPR